MKANTFIIYSWVTAALWFLLIWIISSVANLDVNMTNTKYYFTSFGYELLYAIQFILIFRAILITIKLKVERLMYWKSKREKSEDIEFAKLVERLVILLSLAISLILAMIDEYHQSFVPGRVANAADVIVSFTGSIIALVLVMIVPITAEIEARIFKVNK